MAYLLQDLLNWLHATAPSHEYESIEPRNIDHFSLSRAEKSFTTHLNRPSCLSWTTPSFLQPKKQQPSLTSQIFRAQSSPILRSIKKHPSWKDFTKRSSDEVYHMKQSSRIAALPNELKLAIMQQLPTVQAVLDLTLTSKFFYELKVEYDHAIMPFVLRNELGQAVFEEAYFVAKAMRTDLFHADYAEQLSKFLLEMVYCETGSLQPNAVPLQDAVAMYKFHRNVTFLVTDFCTWALKNSAELRDSCGMELRLSPSEKIRITRAFYRLELFCILFRHRFLLGDGDENVQDKYKTAGPRASQFFDIWPAWETEEIACIRDYIYARLPNVFSNIEEAASTKPFEVIVRCPWEPEPEDLPPNAVYICDSLEPRWYDEDLACRVNFANPVNSDELSEMILCQGLGYVSQLLGAKSPEEQVALFQSKWTEFGLNPDGLGLVRSALRSHPADVLKKGEISEAFFHSDEEIFESDEEAAGPNYAWPWAGGQKFQLYHALTTREGLRQWGYIMWYYERLKNTSLCQSTCELSDSFSRSPQSYVQFHNKICMRKASDMADATETAGTSVTAATTDVADAADTADTSEIDNAADREATEAIDGVGSESDFSNSDPDVVFSEKESDNESNSNASVEHKDKNKHEPISSLQVSDEVAQLREPRPNSGPLSSTTFPAKPRAPHRSKGSVEDVQEGEDVSPNAASAGTTSQNKLEEDGLGDPIPYQKATRITKEFQDDTSHVEAAVLDDGATDAAQAAEVELRKPNLHNFEFDLLPGDPLLAPTNILGELTSSTTSSDTNLDGSMTDAEGFRLDPQVEIESSYQDTISVKDNDSEFVPLQSSPQHPTPTTLPSTQDEDVTTHAEDNEDDSDDEVNFITESRCPREVFKFKAGIEDKEIAAEKDASKDQVASPCFGNFSAETDKLPNESVINEKVVLDTPIPRKIAKAISPKAKMLKTQQTAVQNPEYQVLNAEGPPHLPTTPSRRKMARAVSPTAKLLKMGRIEVPQMEKNEPPAPASMEVEIPGLMLYANQNSTVAVPGVPFPGIPNWSTSSSESTFSNRPEISSLPQPNGPVMPLSRSPEVLGNPPKDLINSCLELQHPAAIDSAVPEAPNQKDCHDVASHTESTEEATRQELSTRSPEELAAWIEGAPLAQLPIPPQAVSSESVNPYKGSDHSNASKVQREKAIPKFRRAAVGPAVVQEQAIKAESARKEASSWPQLPDPPRTSPPESAIFHDHNSHNSASNIQRKKAIPKSRKVSVEPVVKEEQVAQAKFSNDEVTRNVIKIFEAKKDPEKEIAGPMEKGKKKPHEEGRGKPKAKGKNEKMVGYLFG